MHFKEQGRNRMRKHALFLRFPLFRLLLRPTTLCEISSILCGNREQSIRAPHVGLKTSPELSIPPSVEVVQRPPSTRHRKRWTLPGATEQGGGELHWVSYAAGDFRIGEKERSGRAGKERTALQDTTLSQMATGVSRVAGGSPRAMTQTNQAIL